MPRRAAPGSRADVLIVGAGAAGAVAARYLAERDFRVVVLEQGGWVNASDYPGDKPEWELAAAKQWHHDPNVRGLPADYPCEVSGADVAPLMFSAVGGSTIHYGGHWVRLLPSDFRVRTLDGVADDWPLDYEELRPYYERAEADFAVAGLAGDPAYPPGAGPPLPPHPIGKAGRKAAQGMNRLGWHWWPAPQAIASRDHGNLRQCARYGTCESGCPHGAKASVDLTHWPIAIAHGARVVTGARVRLITTDGRGRATGAVWIDRDGAEHLEQADVVVLAANGVGTPRLLLLSASGAHPDGLANSSGLVGKRLMLHPCASVVGVYEEQLESWLGPAGQLIQSMQFYESDGGRGFVRGGKWDLMPSGGPLRMVQLAGDRTGADLQRFLRDTLGHAVDWGTIAEDLPDEANTVTLDEALTDSDGIPAPRITYRIAENTRRLIDFHLERMREAHEAAGAVRTVDLPLLDDQPGHLLGTARMGREPASSVVEPNGRTHDVPNLYVIDGSVFVTAGGCNPTATIAALALRFAEGIAAGARLVQGPA